LIGLLNYNSNQVVRAAAEALGKMGDPRAGEPLLAAIEIYPNPPHYHVWKNIYDALGKIKHPNNPLCREDTR